MITDNFAYFNWPFLFISFWKPQKKNLILWVSPVKSNFMSGLWAILCGQILLSVKSLCMSLLPTISVCLEEKQRRTANPTRYISKTASWLERSFIRWKDHSNSKINSWPSLDNNHKMVQFLYHLEILEQLIVPTKRQNYRQSGDSRDITDGQAKASKQQGGR